MAYSMKMLIMVVYGRTKSIPVLKTGLICFYKYGKHYNVISFWSRLVIANWCKAVQMISRHVYLHTSRWF